MTTAHNIDLPTVLADRLTTAHPDVLRELLATFIHTLMGAEADALCGASYGERSTERTNSRNGYRHRQFDTRAGTLNLAIPKLRHGSYFPDWLLERRKRAERALTTVVATCYLLGVSTRRMDKLVETLGITSLSKSQVSVMAKELDAAVEAFRTRPLDAGPYTFMAADALVLKVREGGRVVNVHALIAVGNFVLGSVLEQQAADDQPMDKVTIVSRVGNFPLLADTISRELNGHDETFETGLALIIEGLRVRLYQASMGAAAQRTRQKSQAETQD